MKKYLLILFLIVFIIPSIALASWWNPFSWKIFQKKQTVHQAQEQKTPEEKINELQKQIDDLKSNVNSNSTNTEKKISINKETENKNKILSTSPKTIEKNYNIELLNSVSETLIAFKSLIDYRNALTSFVDDGVNFIESIRKTTINLRQQISRVADPYLLSNIDNDIKYYNDEKDYWAIAQNGLKEISMTDYDYKFVKEEILFLTDSSNEIRKTSFVSKDTLILWLEMLSDFNQRGNKYFNDLRQVYKKLNEEMDKFTVQMKSNYNLISRYSNLQTNYNVPTPVYVPQVKSPTFTHCNVSISPIGSNATINCNSY